MRTLTGYSVAAVLLAVLITSSSSFAQVRRGRTGTSSTKTESTQNQNNRSATTSSNSSSVRRSSGSSAATTTQSGTTQTRTTTSATRNRTTTTSSQNRTTTTISTSGRTTVPGANSATRTTTATGGTTRTTTATTSGTVTSGTSTHSGTTQTGTTSSVNVTRKGLTSVSTTAATTGSKNSGSTQTASDYRVTNNNVERIAPRERGYQTYNTPKSFYGHDSHYYGWQVPHMPPSYKRVKYYGIDYYLYNDVYYRPYGSSYIVCRPPVGVVVTKTVKTPFGRVTFSFYTNSYRTYTGWDSYSRYIDEQNRIIAQNNAYIAARNRAIAMNLNYAQSSYDLAYRLGLAQSYAYANWDYYYDDGVFYIINRNGRYEVIVPPAGALVDELPDDYETIVINGMELYRVDDTVYRTVLVSGRPYLEVLGQMYGTLASRYSIYR